MSVPSTSSPSEAPSSAFYGGDRDGSGPVRVEARVPRRHGAAAGKHGREPGHQGRSKAGPRTVVGFNADPGPCSERDEFGVEPPGGGCGQGPVVAPQRERVLPFAADLVVDGDVLRGDAHVRIAEAEGGELGPAVVLGGAVVVAVGPERGRADALHAAGQVDAVAARRDQPRGQDDCVQTRAALPVHRDAGYGDGQAGLQRRQPGHVPAAAHGVADHDVGHGLRDKSRPGIGEQAAEHRGQELVGAQPLQGAIGAAERRPARGDNDRLPVRRQQPGDHCRGRRHRRQADPGPRSAARSAKAPDPGVVPVHPVEEQLPADLAPVREGQLRQRKVLERSLVACQDVLDA